MFGQQALQRGRTWWAVVGLTLLGMILWRLAANVGQVSAHALLVRSIPAANAELSQPPAAIDMWFSEPLEAAFSSARLLDSQGQAVTTGALSLDPADPTHLTLSLDPLPPGVYTVAWQTLSQTDGHSWSGSFPLTLLNPDGSRPVAGVVAGSDGRQDELPTPGKVASRWLVLLGGILFFGAPLFQKIVAPAGGKRDAGAAFVELTCHSLVLQAIWVAALAIVLGSWLQVTLQAFHLGGLERVPGLLLETRTGALSLARQLLVLAGLVAALRLLQPWPLAGRERPALALVVAGEALVLLLLIISAVRGEPVVALATLAAAALGMALSNWGKRHERATVKHPAWSALLVLAGALLATISLGSHAGAAPGQVWAVLGDYLHLLAAAAWLGGLALLPLLTWQLGQMPPLAGYLYLLSPVRRFSYLASFAVLFLFLTGLFSSLVELPGMASLWTTAYGRVLLLKLGLVLLAMGLALFNNRLVHGRLPWLVPRFKRQVTTEAILGLGIMLSVATLVQTVTPRSLESEAGNRQPDLPFSIVSRVDDLSIHLQVTPNQVGVNRFLVHLYRPDGSPIGETQLVRLLFDYGGASLGQARADLEPLGQGTYALEGAYLSQPGRWDLSVYVRRRGLDDTLATVSLDVPAPAGEPVASNPWQNPIPALPPGLLVAAGLIALGLLPFLWRHPLREARPRLFPAMRLTGGVLILAGMVAAVGSVLALPAGPTLAGEPDGPASGAKLYQEHCATCHGNEGRGDGPLAASLEPSPGDLRIHVPVHKDTEVYYFISQGLPGTAMPAYAGRLTEEEIWRLVDHLRTEFKRR